MEAYRRIIESVDVELPRQVYQKLEDVQCLVDELPEAKTNEKVHQLNMDILDDLRTIERLYTIMIASADSGYCENEGAVRAHRRVEKVMNYRRDMRLELDMLVNRIMDIEKQHTNERYLICKCSG